MENYFNVGIFLIVVTTMTGCAQMAGGPDSVQQTGYRQPMGYEYVTLPNDRYWAIDKDAIFRQTNNLQKAISQNVDLTGMTKAQIEELFGEPHAVNAFSSADGAPRELWNMRCASDRINLIFENDLVIKVVYQEK